MEANAQLGRIIKQHESEIFFLREQNKLLLNKIIGIERKEIEIGNLQPIGGYKSIRMRVREAEEKSREEYLKLVEKEERKETDAAI